MMDFPTTLEYDLSKENKENITIDYRNSNYKKINLTLPITESQIVLNQDWRLGKGGIFWDGAFFITKYLIDHIYPLTSNEEKSSQWILELGAGTALPSIASLIKGYNVITTDIPKLVPFVSEIIKQNNALYPSTVQYKVEQLSWENKVDITEVKKQKETFDIIIGSELIYLDEVFDDLINVLRDFSNEKTLIMMTYKIRLQSMVDDFITKVSVYFIIEYIEYEYKNEIYPLPEKLKMIRLIKK